MSIESNNDEEEYTFRVPLASSIYHRATSHETFSPLHDANKTCPAHRRLPVEILLLINKEVYGDSDSVYNNIRAIWTPVTHNYEWTGHGLHMDLLSFDKDKKVYYISESEGLDSVSASDMLYRTRCLFPDAYICSVDEYKSVWEVSVQHKQSGLILSFSEIKGVFEVNVTYIGPSVDKKSEAGKAFTTDAV